jgi:hypothetical protein
MSKIIPALGAGCTLVHKPSEITPLNTLLLAEIAAAAGVPAGVYNVVIGTGPNIGEHLVRHAEVDMVAFTGSTGAGRRVYELSAPTPTSPPLSTRACGRCSSPAAKRVSRGAVCLSHATSSTRPRRSRVRPRSPIGSAIPRTRRQPSGRSCREFNNSGCATSSSAPSTKGQVSWPAERPRHRRAGYPDRQQHGLRAARRRILSRRRPRHLRCPAPAHRARRHQRSGQQHVGALRRRQAVGTRTGVRLGWIPGVLGNQGHPVLRPALHR